MNYTKEQLIEWAEELQDLIACDHSVSEGSEGVSKALCIELINLLINLLKEFTQLAARREEERACPMDWTAISKKP